MAEVTNPFFDKQDFLYTRQLIKDAIEHYFVMKDGKLQFLKKCNMGNYFTTTCANNTLQRIKEFVSRIKLLLAGKPINIQNFKLIQVDPRVRTDSIKSALDALNAEQKVDPAVQALISMCTTSEQDVLSAQKAELERNTAAAADDADDADDADANAVVTTGGRRSRYRRRPTKKYFKSRHRRHSLSKKKRHMKTKRHMKRHRKTKRHIKRY